MNSSPRGLNRWAIGFFGFVLIAIGAGLLALVVIPAVASAWRNWSGGAWNSLQQVIEQARLPGGGESWIWLALAAVLLVIIVLVLALAAQQGKGRATLLSTEVDAGGEPGDISIGGAVAEQAVRAALAGRPDLPGVSVATYEYRGKPALRIRLQPRQGVAPHLLAGEVADLVMALERVVGHQIPVLIHVGVGARSRLSRAERVR